MGLMIFGAFAVGLKAANLETNVEKLWVEGKADLFHCFTDLPSEMLGASLSAVVLLVAAWLDTACFVKVDM